MDKIPLPTDNIYKFYALFGLLLFIFSIGASIALTKNTNDTVYKLYVELESLRIPTIEEMAAYKDGVHPTFVRKALLEKLIEVAKKDRTTIEILLTAVTVIGGLGVLYGFRKWHKEIQPIQDEMLQLQVEKLRREVAALAPVPKPPVPDAPAENQSKDSLDQSPAAST